MRYAKILGTGSYLPEKVLTNEELQKMVDTSSEWIMERVGIKSRHIVAKGENASDMAEIASKKALAASGINAQELDLIIVGTSSPDYIFPSTACLLQKKLSAKNCPAFDVSAACSGFIYALHIAEMTIKSGQAKYALVVGSEVMSRLVDWQDRSTCVLFGDGAGAVVLGSSSQPGIISSKISSDASSSELLTLPNVLPGQNEDKQHVVYMQGKEVFKIAVNTLESLVIKTLEENNITKEEIDWLIPHQANLRIIAATAKKLGLSMDQVILTLPQQGNTSCASIPLALDAGVRDGRIKSGQLLLLEAFGGGLTWGATLLRF